MSYYNGFTMQDLFCNKKLDGVLPQFNKKDILKGDISETDIFSKCQELINGYLGGKIEGDKIIVEGKTQSQVRSILKACKLMLEAFFNNSTEILKGLKSNKKLYTSFVSVEQLKRMDAKGRNKAVNEIMDNLLYNPDFVGDGKNPSFKRKQTMWKKKVGYKEK